MSPTHDPRPASRYQAVTPSAFREHIATRQGVANPAAASGPRSRVLSRVSAQLVSLVIRA